MFNLCDILPTEQELNLLKIMVNILSQKCTDDAFGPF